MMLGYTVEGLGKFATIMARLGRHLQLYLCARHSLISSKP